MKDIKQIIEKYKNKFVTTWSKFSALSGEAKLTILALFIAIVTLLLGDNLVGRIFSTISENEKDDFPSISLVNPIVNLKSKIYLLSEDSTFFTTNNLDIEFEGLKFRELAKPVSGYGRQYWHFSLYDKKLPRDLMTNGIKTLSVAFPNSKRHIDMKLYLNDSTTNNFFQIPELSDQMSLSKSDISSKDYLYNRVLKDANDYFLAKGNSSITLLSKADTLKFEVYTKNEVLYRGVSNKTKNIIGANSSPSELLVFVFYADKIKGKLDLNIDGYFGSGLYKPRRNGYFDMEIDFATELNQYREIWNKKFAIVN